MAVACEAIDFVLGNEGGISNDPNDLGGVTNKGISLRFLQGVNPIILKSLNIASPVTAQTVLGLSDTQIDGLYGVCFWGKAPFGEVSSQRLANYVFDCAVNMGLGQGVKVAQRGCNALLVGFPITVDGVLGDQTLNALNSIAEAQLVKALPAARIRVYHTIVLNVPGDRVFLNGWLKRAQRI